MLPYDHGQPLARIDHLPILFFLFLLVAAALSLYRPQPHALLIGFPVSFAAAAPAPTDRSTHQVAINESGEVLIDGTYVPDTFLPEALARLRRLRETPRIQFAPEGRLYYGRVIEVLGIIKAAGLADQSFCFADLPRYKAFDKSWRAKPMYFSLIWEPPHDPISRVDPPPCEPPTREAPQPA